MCINLAFAIFLLFYLLQTGYFAFGDGMDFDFTMTFDEKHADTKIYLRHIRVKRSHSSFPIPTKLFGKRNWFTGPGSSISNRQRLPKPASLYPLTAEDVTTLLKNIRLDKKLRSEKRAKMRTMSLANFDKNVKNVNNNVKNVTHDDSKSDRKPFDGIMLMDFQVKGNSTVSESAMNTNTHVHKEKIPKTTRIPNFLNVNPKIQKADFEESKTMLQAGSIPNTNSDPIVIRLSCRFCGYQPKPKVLTKKKWSSDPASDLNSNLHGINRSATRGIPILMESITNKPKPTKGKELAKLAPSLRPLFCKFCMHQIPTDFNVPSKPKQVEHKRFNKPKHKNMNKGEGNLDRPRGKAFANIVPVVGALFCKFCSTQTSQTWKSYCQRRNCLMHSD